MAHERAALLGLGSAVTTEPLATLAVYLGLRLLPRLQTCAGRWYLVWGDGDTS